MSLRVRTLAPEVLNWAICSGDRNLLERFISYHFGWIMMNHESFCHVLDQFVTVNILPYFFVYCHILHIIWQKYSERETDNVIFRTSILHPIVIFRQKVWQWNVIFRHGIWHSIVILDDGIWQLDVIFLSEYDIDMFPCRNIFVIFIHNIKW